MKLYGIPNCDSVKKARSWLNESGKVYEFHDFKKQGVSTQLLSSWINQVGWESLVNKQGTTWRKLSADIQDSVVDPASAIALMQTHPSLIKRPVLDLGGRLLIGFKPDIYASIT